MAAALAGAAPVAPVAAPAPVPVPVAAPAAAPSAASAPAPGALPTAALPPAAAPLPAARAAELEHMIVQDCGSCHGLTLKGGLGKPITAEALAGRDPDGLAEIILEGVPGTAMPPWKPLLTPAEARWIADWLLTEKP